MGGSVEFGLFVDGESGDPAWIKKVVARQVLPKRHATYAGFGHVDRLQPDA